MRYRCVGTLKHAEGHKKKKLDSEAPSNEDTVENRDAIVGDHDSMMDQRAEDEANEG